MSKVLTHMTMSLDGFVADPHDQPGELFDWYFAGDTPAFPDKPGTGMQVDPESARFLAPFVGRVGALVSGRRLFDQTDGWGDDHPVGAPVVVVTHQPPDDAARWPRTSFVDGVEAGIARAREVAGDQDVVIASPTIISQALDLGLVDEVWVSLVPVLFGTGVPYFQVQRHHLLEDPTVIAGSRATHLGYAVRR